MGADRIAVGAFAPTISAAFRDGAGTVVAPGAVTVGVVDWAGTVVLAPGSATTPAPEGVVAVVPSPTAPTRLTATWSAAGGTVTTTVDVVGSRIVWPEEVLAQPDVNSRSAAEVSAAIGWFEDLAWRAMNWSPVVRFARQPVYLDRSPYRLPDYYVTRLLGVTVQRPGAADQILTATQVGLLQVSAGGSLVDSYGSLPALLTSGCGGVAQVAYLHGAAAGQDLHDAALVAIRHHLLDQSSGQPIISVAGALGGTTRYALAGKDAPTGIPDVDSVLNSLRIPAVG